MITLAVERKSPIWVHGTDTISEQILAVLYRVFSEFSSSGASLHKANRRVKNCFMIGGSVGGKLRKSQSISENLGRPENRSSRPFEHF
jgi:hypothetical protein